ncbi:MAG TPA: LuxR C-terminal-related transcriptional regulator, partial [Candidatus Sutterella merdavium]|nr:LuxR C-terminal-related transcriptional regulator [Candidatus Sutterella merdavium]
LTGHGDIEMAVQALHDGAADFLVKPVDGSKLTEAVAKALEAKRRVEMGLPDLTAMLDRWGKLTTREKEIVLCVGRGWMNKTIACEYDISIRTVEAHRASALRKLGLTTPAQIAELIAELRSRGYLPKA